MLVIHITCSFKILWEIPIHYTKRYKTSLAEKNVYVIKIHLLKGRLSLTFESSLKLS